MPTEHDRLFKTLLRTFFPGFLGLVVPDLAERLDAARASFLDKEFLAEEPAGKREADLVARVPVRNDGVLLVHVEIEARAGAFAVPLCGLRARPLRRRGVPGQTGAHCLGLGRLDESRRGEPGRLQAPLPEPHRRGPDAL
ncbi:MAG TPA: hypothetical protein VGK45_15260 [Thermoanaerobaculia bacterium]